jgi:hypothetical protein
VASPPSIPASSARPPRDIKRTIIIVVGVVIALNLLIAGGFATRNTTSTPDLPSGIAELFPPKGEVTTQQAEIGVVLQRGYSGELTLDGQPLPKDQYEPTGLAIGEVFWRPGPGKVYLQTPPGNHTLSVNYWPTTQGPGGPDARTFAWAFKVT